MLSSIGGGIDARPPTARARYPCPFRLATSLCENPALAHKLIGRHHLAQSRLMAAVAAVAVGVISAPQLAVAAPPRPAVGPPLQPQQPQPAMPVAGHAGVGPPPPPHLPPPP